MKQIFENGKTKEVTECFNDSLMIFNEQLSEYNIPPISEKEAGSDFGIKGGETISELIEWARDYVSDLQTERAEAKNAWRYEI